jgi:hypothetical protein
VVTAQPCIMVVSDASGAEATVKAAGSGPGLAGFAQLFEAGTSLRLSGAVSNVQQVVTRERAPLMWRGRWLHGLLRKSWISRDHKGEETIPPFMFDDFDDPTVFEEER